jgi:hypothetical protein
MKHSTRDRVGAPDALNQDRIGWSIYEREEHLETTMLTFGLFILI